MSLDAEIAAGFAEVNARLRALQGGAGGGGHTRRSCQIRNTDSTTSINASTWTEVPIGGVVDSQSTPDFTVVGNGIRCNFAGPIKATVHVPMSSSSGRSNAIVDIARNGTRLGVRGKSGYIRAAGGHDESSSSIPGLELAVADGDVISVQSLQEGAPGSVTLDAGGAYLLLERWA